MAAAIARRVVEEARMAAAEEGRTAVEADAASSPANLAGRSGSPTSCPILRCRKILGLLVLRNLG